MVPKYLLFIGWPKIPVVHGDASTVTRVLLPRSLAGKALGNGNHPIRVALFRLSKNLSSIHVYHHHHMSITHLAKNLLGKENCVAGVQLLPHVTEAPAEGF